MLASQYGFTEKVRLLLKYRSNEINKQNDMGFTALHFACMNVHLDVVRLLVAHGANVNCRNSFGETPLARLLNCGSHQNSGKEIIKILVAHGGHHMPEFF
jgi:ankyrin repeat protein